MSRFGFVGSSYTAQSNAIADEECINFFAETNESGGAFDIEQAYGGREYASLKSYFGTPGLKTFCTFPAPVRAQIPANGRHFVVAGTAFYEVFSDGTFTKRGDVSNDGKAASLAFNSVQILIVSGGSAYCFTLATDALVEVTGQLAGVPLQCDESDTYFIVSFKDSNKFQMSQLLDGTTWPGQLVNEVSVFPDNLTSIIVNHRELWVFGNRRSQPYQDTGSAEVFDPIGGALIEVGGGATFSAFRLDNSVFWIGQDERGAWVAWRSNGYNPQRVSTHAVEVWLSQQADVADCVSYAYQDRGHLFWVLYVPNSDCSWVYDVAEGLWHKRASWINGFYKPHFSWNHAYVFGKHLVGDWNSGNLYEMSFDYLDDNGAAIRRLRRSPTTRNEMNRVYFAELRVELNAGNGPQPPLMTGGNVPREPQAMLRWSDDGGNTWSNEHWRGCGFAGQFKRFVRWQRLGQGRRRVFEFVVTDPVEWAITDAYLRLGNGQ